MVVGAGDPLQLEAEVAGMCALVAPSLVVLGADDLVGLEVHVMADLVLLFV